MTDNVLSFRPLPAEPPDTLLGLLEAAEGLPDATIARLIDHHGFSDVWEPGFFAQPQSDGRPDEEWRPISGYEGTYSVSSLGRVRRESRGHGTRPGRILKESLGNRGYMRVNLGHADVRLIHALVAEAFLGTRPSGLHINHRDGVKANNRADNLEYVTPAGNVRHASENGLLPRGKSHHHVKLTERQVLEIRQLKGKARSRDIGATYAISRQTVADIWAGRHWRWLACPEGDRADG